MVEWTTSDDADWLSVTPTSGTNTGELRVWNNESNSMTHGTYTGTVKVEAPAAVNSPQTMTVGLNIMAAGSTAPPFGSFDTPIAESTISSSVPFPWFR